LIAASRPPLRSPDGPRPLGKRTGSGAKRGEQVERAGSRPTFRRELLALPRTW
jgi:hypothetical protein